MVETLPNGKPHLPQGVHTFVCVSGSARSSLSFAGCARRSAHTRKALIQTYKTTAVPLVNDSTQITAEEREQLDEGYTGRRRATQQRDPKHVYSEASPAGLSLKKGSVRSPLLQPNACIKWKSCDHVLLKQLVAYQKNPLRLSSPGCTSRGAHGNNCKRSGKLLCQHVLPLRLVATKTG